MSINNGFSVVIPTANRTEVLIESLDFLQATLAGLELSQVIVINDGTAQSLDSVQLKHKWVSFLDNKSRGVSYARNMGVDFAKYDDIVIMDDDMLLPVGALESGLANIRANPESFYMPHWKYLEEVGFKLIAIIYFIELYEGKLEYEAYLSKQAT